MDLIEASIQDFPELDLNLDLEDYEPVEQPKPIKGIKKTETEGVNELGLDWFAKGG
jgi:hypothetical protein